MVESHWSTHPNVPSEKSAGLRFVWLSSTGFSIGRVSKVYLWMIRCCRRVCREEAVVRDSAKWVTRMVARRRYDWLSLLTQRTRPGVVASSRRIRGWSAGLPAMDLIRFPTFPLLRSIRPRGYTSLSHSWRNEARLNYIRLTYSRDIQHASRFFFLVWVNFINDDDNFWGRRRFLEKRYD